METIGLCIVFGFFIIFAYTLGLRNGQKVINKKEITGPKVPNIIETINEISETKKEKERLSEYEKLFNNIDNYGNPDYEQKEVIINE